MKGNSIFSGDLSLNMNNNATLNAKIENYIVTIRDLEQEVVKVVERQQYYQQLSKDALVPRTDIYLLKHAQARLAELRNHELELAAMLDMLRTDGAKYNDEYIITTVVSRVSGKVVHTQITKYRDLPNYGPVVSQLVDL